MIFLEDKSFYKNKGISLKGIARALLGIVKIRRPSGGSTITQQLVRTLFIKDYFKIFRRKIIEILLALWCNKQFTKEEILEMHISSVRYHNKVNGIAAAYRHFFEGEKPLNINMPKAFFLIERISNLFPRILLKRVQTFIHLMKEEKIIDEKDENEIKKIYYDMYLSSKLTLDIHYKEPFFKWVKINTD